MNKHELYNRVPHESSSLSLRAERVVEEARRQRAESAVKEAIEQWRRRIYPSLEADVFYRFLADKSAEGWDETRQEVAALEAIVLRALLASQEAAPSAQWQDIATAPKDGTAVRLRWQGTTVEAVGRWCPAKDWPEPYASDDWRDVKGDDVLLMPTHWKQEGSPR